MNKKPIFITWCFSRHGIAFLMQSIRALKKQKNALENWSIGKELRLVKKKHSQYELYKEVALDQLPFEKIYYLVPKDLKEWARIYPAKWANVNRDKDNLSVKTSMEGESKTIQKALEVLLKETELPSLKKTEDIFKNHNADMVGLWHLINDYPLEDQIYWAQNHAFPENTFEIIPLDIANTEDAASIKQSLEQFLKGIDMVDRKLMINLYGTTTENQIAWYFLAWHQKEMENAVLVKCRDDKQKKKRFGDISVEVARKDLLDDLIFKKSSISNPIDSQLSKVRKNLNFFIKQGNLFPIFLLGDRGVGKTSSIESFIENAKTNLITINCASYSGISDHNMIRTELFGCKKGAHSVATKDIDGAFKKANGKTLFMDEIHHLPKSVQVDLLRALQTDEDGNYRFKPVGGLEETPTRFQLISASNRPWEKLMSDSLLEHDLLDRISQRVITLPSFKDERDASKEKFGNIIKEHWQKNWKTMKFKYPDPYEKHPALSKWLIAHPFKGNYRDIQKISILCYDWLTMDPLIRSSGSLIEYIEKESKYSTSFSEFKKTPQDTKMEIIADSISGVSFNDFKTGKDAEKEFKCQYAAWAIKKYGTIKSASNVTGFKSKDTLHRWGKR